MRVKTKNGAKFAIFLNWWNLELEKITAGLRDENTQICNRVEFDAKVLARCCYGS